MKPYVPASDCPHIPGPEDRWQESDWLTFYDPEVGVGGIYRIGQEPNVKTGQPGLFVFAKGGDRFFMQDLGGRGRDVPLAETDRWETGYRVDGHEVEALGNGKLRYRWASPGTSGELTFSQPFYTPRDWSNTGKGADIMATLNPDGHLECAGRVAGDVSINGKTYRVDCFGHRDRSWGFRPPYVSRAKRILAAWGTCGPSFSYATMLYEPKDAPALVTGFVARNGQTDEIADLQMLTTIDSDFVSPVHGVVILTLESGEVIRIDCDIVQAHAGWAPGSAFNSVGTFMRDGLRGFCDYAAAVNPSQGTHIAAGDEVTLAVASHGLSKTTLHPT